jgi:ubiquitin-like protein Pup
MATSESGGGQRRGARRDAGTEEVETETTAAAEGAERREKLSEDVDSVLDEIDQVLEENAEDFVKAYVQKGGE